MLFVLAVTTYGQGSDTVLIVKAIDRKTKKIIPHANITIAGTDGMTMYVKADDNGIYVFDKTVLKAGERYVLSCGLIPTYMVWTAKFSLEEGFPPQPFELNFELYKWNRGDGLPNIYFDKNSCGLRPESRVAIDNMCETMEDNPTIVFEICGHADFREKNPEELALKRAKAIAEAMILEGVNPDRLKPVGYGCSMPRILENDISMFMEGDTLNKKYVEALKDPQAIKESLQLNGRVGFKVLRHDYETSK